MQRVVTAVVVLVIVLATAVNLLLFTQNQDLRHRLAAQPPPAALSADQAAKLEQLSHDLERYKKNYNSVMNESRGLREQNSQLSSAAQERDTLKSEVETLKRENTELKSQVQNLQTMNTINGQVSALRNMPARSNVPRSFMNQNQLREHFTASYAKEYSADAEARDQAVLQALDMGSGGKSGDLRAAQIDSLVKSVLGFYDHETKQLVVVTNRPQMGVEDRITYAHEYTHSLQDQYYGLASLFARAEGNADYELAIRGLVEGDATLTMSLYAQKHLDAFDMVNYQLEKMSQLDPYAALYGCGCGGPQVESATYFPYQEGAAFAAGLYAQGGFGAISRAFANPPRSTEQVLHPEKYAQGDMPVNVAMPNLAQALGWKLVQENTLGELYLRIYLEHELPLDTAIVAGEGWGGDRYQVLENEKGQLAFALNTAWDSEDDASEFFDAYNQFVLTLGGAKTTVLESNGTHLRYQLDGRQFYLSRAGKRVITLHAPDGATLDGMLAQFR